MSNIYHLEPPTKGKVVFHTTHGDIDVELWPRETPMTCRNFVQLALEGYYDGTLFHRVIPGFMVQGGDPTGTGAGGESIYEGGKPFKDEIHTRLKFTHRGLLAMANENKPNSNTSQFFFTLDACDHLKGKHTIFGKVTGDTVFNLLRIGEAQTDMDDRPLEPIKLEWVEVLANPFDDIVPRDMSAAIKKRREAMGAPVETAEEIERKKREAKRQERLARAAKKDTKLLSFADDEDEEDEDGGPLAAGGIKKKKGGLKSSHDVMTEDPALQREVDPELLKAVAAEPSTKPAAAAGGGGGDGVKPGASRRREDKEEEEAVGGPEVVAALPGADDEAAAFAARMRLQVQRKRKLGEGGGNGGGGGGGGPSKRGAAAAAAAASEGEEDEGGPAFSGDLASQEEEERRREQKRLVKEKAEEYQRLKAEMARNKRAVNVETGAAARKRDEERAHHDMLTPLEARRQKYLDKKRRGTSREDETLAKLAGFSSGLFSKRKDTGGSSGSSSSATAGKGKEKEEEEKEKEKEPETYYGQVTERTDILDGGDEDEDDADWFMGGLKFKKHIDDKFRTDDYVTIPSKAGKPPNKRDAAAMGGGGGWR